MAEYNSDSEPEIDFNFFGLVNYEFSDDNLEEEIERKKENQEKILKVQQETEEETKEEPDQSKNKISFSQLSYFLTVLPK